MLILLDMDKLNVGPEGEENLGNKIPDASAEFAAVPTSADSAVTAEVKEVETILQALAAFMTPRSKRPTNAVSKS